MKNLNIFSLISEYENAKSGGVLNKPNVSFINEDSNVRYLTDIKYEYVDLGLSVKWATCNVGARSPEQAGLYFAWGETTGYTGEQVPDVRAFTENEYKVGPAASIYKNLTLEHDVAHICMGGNWRMPTKAEYQELLDNCNMVWTDDYNGTGMAGWVFTSKANGNSVFFPVAGICHSSSVHSVGSDGYYWSASWDSSSSARDSCAWGLYISHWYHRIDNGGRYYGQSVRGVCE